jgi:hypothetical protein
MYLSAAQLHREAFESGMALRTRHLGKSEARAAIC